MNEWKNLNELSAYQQLLKAGREFSLPACFLLSIR